MGEHELSCIYYPTTVVIVDDNKSFLEILQLKIGKDILCKSFSAPEEALSYIQNSTTKNGVLKDIIGIDEGSGYYSHTSGQLPLQYDVSKIYKHVYNKNCFDEISVVVVDYEMPNMNGEKFCSALKQQKRNPIKIIMLTGEADEPMAIRLFNAGIIDKFLRKAQPGVYEELKNSIVSMQKRYFYDLTYPIVQEIASDKDSSLGDPAFIALFNQICKEFSASSYYLIEVSGSFLFIDNAGSTRFLIIKTLNELSEISSQLDDDKLPIKLIESIKNGELVPYFGDLQEDFYTDKSIFEKNLFPAKKLKGEKNYAYAVVDKIQSFSLETDQIVSFNKYLSMIE